MTPLRFLLPPSLVALEPIGGIGVAPTSPTARIQYELTFGNVSDAGYFIFEFYTGDNYAASVLSLDSKFVLKTFNQKVGEGKGYMEVLLTYESFAGMGIGSYPVAVASTRGNNIHLNTEYIRRDGVTYCCDSLSNILMDSESIAFERSFHDLFYM
ncbi:Exostosin domain-containing protein [Psidium guajava]|nr:Exostosin domain-containing protein [Psidium guajava]